MLSLMSSPLGFASMPKPQPKPPMETNPCEAGADPETGKPPIWTALANLECGGDGAKVQSGADVTVGSEGTLTAGLQPITASYHSQGMCAAQPPNTVFLASIRPTTP